MHWTAIEPGASYDHLRFLLPEEEQARADRFHFARDRAIHTVAHALLRRCLEAATGRRDWHFRRNAFGKPELAEPAAGELRFNLSHTRGLAACALAFGPELGIDVEEIDAGNHEAGNDRLALARHVFAPAEHAFLAAQPPEKRAETFFLLWTGKEAVVKALGQGLSLSLADFVISWPDFRNLSGGGLMELRFAPHRPEDPSLWQVWSCLLGRHAAALAIRRKGGEGGGVALPAWHGVPVAALAETPFPAL